MVMGRRVVIAEVLLWGRTIGAVSIDDGTDVVRFQYDDLFTRSGIQVAPLQMPLSPRVYTFPDLLRTSFRGLPGLLADSLPDKFGNAIIDAWLARQGRSAESMNVVERLCYIGNRGMGALEYKPRRGPDLRSSIPLEVDELVRLASDVLVQRNTLRADLSEDVREHSLRDILLVGTSAGGARAKALIAWNPTTNEVRSGQVDVGEGFQHWLLKFDGVHGNGDKEGNDPVGYGLIEFAYSIMAQAAGVNMMECRILEEQGRRHFMTRRFDRTPDGKKIHMQTLGAMAHADFNAAGQFSYEQAILTMRALQLPPSQIEQFFRRMVFNIVARNQDDHVKNISFLMDKQGTWSLAPAYDCTFSFNPRGLWTATHQMTLNGKRDHFTLDDIEQCGKVALLKRGQARNIIEEVTKAVASWPDIAVEAGVWESSIPAIYATFRRDILP